MIKSKTSDHITQDEIKKLVSYENGVLYWLPRGINKFDNRYAGKEAACKSHNKGYSIIRINYRLILTHRAIWIYHNGQIPTNMEIDHINGNRLDNRIENLRLATIRENSLNQKLKTNNTSGHKNITWDKSRNKWQVQMGVEGNRNKVLGRYADLQDAVKAAEYFREKFHGSFANHGQQIAEVA